VKVHHLNLCTMCPYGGRLIDGGTGPILAGAEMVVHALLVETSDGLVLVDTGMGLDDVRAPGARLGRGFVMAMRMRLSEADTAVRQIERLGFRREDVRHIVVTHLDLDHAGGIPDFPEAQIHVHRAEHAAAMARPSLNERNRYRKVHFAGNPRWALHEAEGERWFGFASVRAVAEDVLLIPMHGHTRGHSAVAVRAPSGSGAEWLLHCGDAYFAAGELEEPPSCPAGLAVFQRVIAVDDEARVANAARLRALHREAGERVRIFSAHDPAEYRAAARSSA
jgi:glyoxylase-like metal-dependent hydrolase (beta-lactamase superfamily II)